MSTAPTVVPVWYWTDANDFAMAAAPSDIPSIEIGFLDGRQEPEIFVQDAPTVGSLFASDKITYKIRHIYGGAVTDYRGLQARGGLDMRADLHGVDGVDELDCLSPDDESVALDLALHRYDRDRPRKLVKDVLSDGSRLLAAAGRLGR